MDKVILENKFDGITQEDAENDFSMKMNDVTNNNVEEAELIKAISALAQKVKEYHPLRHSEGYNMYMYAIYRVKDVLMNITNDNFITPILSWMKSIILSGWTEANSDFLIEASYLLPRGYFSSMKKPQLEEHFCILDITDFEILKQDGTDNEYYVRDMQNRFTGNFFFDHVDSNLKEQSKDMYEEFLKKLYLKCWSKNKEIVNIYARMIAKLYRTFSNLYEKSPDRFVDHFQQICSKIIEEDILTTEGQTEIIGFFVHRSLLKNSKEVAEKIVEKWIAAFINIYKAHRSWTKSIIRTLVDCIEELYKSCQELTFKACEYYYNETVEIFMLLLESCPTTSQHREVIKPFSGTREECISLLKSIQQCIITPTIKKSEQFEIFIPSLLKLIHYNEYDLETLFKYIFNNHNKEIQSFLKAKPDIINPFITQFIDSAIFFGSIEDTTIEFPFGRDQRNLSSLYDTIKNLGKTTRAFNAPTVQDNFQKGFLKLFNNYTYCASTFITNFYDVLIFKDYSADDMLLTIQAINKTLSLELFHRFNPFNFGVSNLYSNINECISKSTTKYASCFEEISKTPEILLRFDLQWDHDGNMMEKPSSVILISLFSKFLMTKGDSRIVLLFYPQLFDVIEKSNESEGFYSSYISYVFTCQYMIAEPQLLQPYIGKIIDIGEKIFDTDLHSNLSSMINGLNTISSTKPSCLFPYLEKLESFLSKLEDDNANFNMLIGIFSLAYTESPEKIKDSVVEKIASKINIDVSSACQVVAFFGIIVKHNPKILIPFLNDILACLRTQKIYVLTNVNIILTEFLQQDQKLGEKIFEEIVKIIEENLDDANFINMSLNGLRSFGIIRHDLLVTLKEKVEKWQQSKPVIHDMCQQLLDIIADRSLATLDKNLSKQKEVITVVDKRLVKTEDKVEGIQKDVKIQETAITDVNNKIDVTNVKVQEIGKEVEVLEEQVQEIDMKTVSNAPKWAREVSKLMNPESDNDWRLLASRLGYSNDDIRAWSTQADPCMSLLSEWFAVRKHIEATKSVLEQLIEMNLLDVAKIVENALTAAEAVISDDDPIEFVEPPLVFLSYQWAVQEEVKILRSHLQKAGYRCWMDIGQMGGGDKLYEAIDRGIRGAKVFIACVTEKYSQSPNCKRELNLAITLNKSVIPLQMERMPWPPPGTMGPLLTEYVFIRMFAKPDGKIVEGTFWPKDRFHELLMQTRYGCAPEYENVDEEYKDWWKPPEEKNIYVSKKELNDKVITTAVKISNNESPEIFISYQWGKQEEVRNLYNFLNSKGFSCWMDIYQMGGGDSLFDKIDRGIRGCKLMISCVTPKYSESVNCRREISLCDNLKRPLIPILLEQMSWPPEGAMSMVLTQLVYISFVDSPKELQTWTGPSTDKLLQRINQIIPKKGNSVPVKTNVANMVKRTDLNKKTVKPPSAEFKKENVNANKTNVKNEIKGVNVNKKVDKPLSSELKREPINSVKTNSKNELRKKDDKSPATVSEMKKNMVPASKSNNVRSTALQKP